MQTVAQINDIVTQILWESECLSEMANLRPSVTGFDYYIWVGPKPPQHGPRIKVVNEKGRIDFNDSFSVSIADNPKIVAGIASVPGRDLVRIFDWVKLNKEILLKHSNMEIDDDDLKAGLQKLN